MTDQKRRRPSASADAAKASERLRVPAQSALGRIAKALELGRRGRRVRQMARKHEPQDAVEVVNFINPWRRSANPGVEAVQTAEAMAASGSLRCATLPCLVALKLYAGSLRDQADVVELLRHNPNADRALIRQVCAKYGSASMFDELARQV